MVTLISGVSRGIGKALFERSVSSSEYTIGLTRSSVLQVKQQTSKSVIIGVNYDELEGLPELIKSLTQGTGIDVLINNAGVLQKSELKEETLEGFLFHQKVNTWYPFYLFKVLEEENTLSKQAHIVNISSMGGVQGVNKYSGLFSYSASKSGLIALTEFLDVEFGGKGYSFNSLALGAVQTEMLKEAFPDYFSEVTSQKMAEFVFDFATRNGDLMSGKTIQVQKSDPKG